MNMSETAKKGKKNISITTDDLRQVFVIGKNEMRKFFRGRKVLLLIILAALFLVINIVLTAKFSIPLFDSSPENLANVMFNISSIITLHSIWIPFISLLGAVLFASYTIVSEFEERTYLLLFTRPVKKTTIFVGKFLASYLITLLVVLLYYGIAIGHTLIVGGEAGKIDLSVLTSIGLTMAYIFAVSGLAMLFSCISKKGSISALMTFFLVTMVPSMMSIVLLLALPGEAHWYILDKAGETITSIMNVEGSVLLSQPLTALFIWGVIPLVAGWIIFLKREA
jgi:ABC-2 type transport system permease protein